MTDLDAATSERATLETAPTRYVEGGGIRFAYRQLGPSTGTPLVLLQHFSGNIDAWDPAVVNAAGVGPSRDRVRQRWRRPLHGQDTGQCCRHGARRRDIPRPSRLLESRSAGIFARRLRRSADRGRTRLARPEADPRRHSATGRRRALAGGSRGGFLPHRSARSAAAAVLYPIGGQPSRRQGVSRPSLRAQGRSRHRQRQRRNRSTGEGADHLVRNA